MPYETITIPSETQFRHKSSVGFAGIHLRVASSPIRKVEVKSEVTATDVPEKFVRSCLDGILECIDGGGLIDGSPIEKITVTLLNAEYYPEHSTVEAFRRAGFSGFRDLYHKAKPTVVDD